MFSMPKTITNITKTITARLEIHTTASLAKTEKLAAIQADELKMWAEVQDDVLNERIATHLKRKQLSAADQAAVNAWRTAQPAE